MSEYRTPMKPSERMRRTFTNLKDYETSPNTEGNYGYGNITPTKLRKVPTYKEAQNNRIMRVCGNDKPYGLSFSFIPPLHRSQTPQINKSLESNNVQEMNRMDRKQDICKEMCLCGKHHSPTKDIKYKYPKTLGSFYQKEFQRFRIPIPTEVYIHEKHKNHRNCHKMDLITQNQVMYKAPRKNDYMQECKKVRTTNRTPFTGGSSSYAKAFPNWGPHIVNIEKHPQYPVHTVPFKGKSSYADSYRTGNNSRYHSNLKTDDHHIFFSDLPFEKNSFSKSEFSAKKGDRFPAYKPDREVYIYSGTYIFYSHIEHFNFQGNLIQQQNENLEGRMIMDIALLDAV